MGNDIVIHVVGTKSDVVAQEPSLRKIPFERCIAYVAENLYPQKVSTPTFPGSARSSGFWGQEIGTSPQRYLPYSYPSSIPGLAPTMFRDLPCDFLSISKSQHWLQNRKRLGLLSWDQCIKWRRYWRGFPCHHKETCWTEEQEGAGTVTRAQQHIGSEKRSEWLFWRPFGYPRKLQINQ